MVLLDQAPNQVRVSISDFPYAVSRAESFTMPADATISEIRIWAVYHSGNTPLDPDNFTVIFHDDADDLPGGECRSPRIRPGRGLQGDDLGTPLLAMRRRARSAADSAMRFAALDLRGSRQLPVPFLRRRSRAGGR